MRKVRLPSLELSWLPNRYLKGLLLPDIFIIESSDEYSGCYTHACDNLPRGEIVVVEDNRYAGSLAHEFRHFYQQFNIGLPSSGSNWANHSRGMTYENAIRSYFKTQWWELDALKFEHKYARDDINDEWMGWLYD